MAEDGQTVYLPMPFRAEAGVIRTTACLQVTERVYPQSAWWEDSSGDAGALEHAFKAVIAALKRKDRAALLELSDPTHGRDLKRFDEQAAAYFQQFDAIELVAVPRAYEFDGLVVLFSKFRRNEQAFYVPFVFTYKEDGSFGFLPYQTDQLTYRLVDELFRSMGGVAATDNPPYCRAEEIKRATHRIPLGSSPGNPKPPWHPSYLLLTGASFDTPGGLAPLVAQVTSTIEDIKQSALVDGGLDRFVKHLTPEGGNSVKKWFASADQIERSGWKTSGYERYDGLAITEQQPFFVFDASPLVVIYTRSLTGHTNVMYFTFHADHELLWTNFSHITDTEKMFERGPLYDAALLDKPFSNIAIK